MTRTVHPSPLYLLACLLSVVAPVRRTAHGAHRINLGTYRFHIDADGVIIWKAGGPRILATLTHPEPEPKAAHVASPWELDAPLFADDDRPLGQAFTTSPDWAPIARTYPRPVAMTVGA